MDLLEFADLINKEIVINYYPNQGGRFTAKFDRCEIKDGGALISAYENGNSPREAMERYAERISNAHLVFESHFRESRQEYHTKTLSYNGRKP